MRTDDQGEQGGLRKKVDAYLRAHHVMTVATLACEGDIPHAAHVFYASDAHMRLVFLSKKTSMHGQDIAKEAPVAVTVSGSYDDWRQIKGVQLWGKVRLLAGAAKADALSVYLTHFPFVRDLLEDPGLITRVRDLGVYRVEAEKIALTDNASGLFGRETLDLMRQ